MHQGNGGIDELNSHRVVILGAFVAKQKIIEVQLCRRTVLDQFLVGPLDSKGRVHSLHDDEGVRGKPANVGVHQLAGWA